MAYTRDGTTNTNPLAPEQRKQLAYLPLPTSPISSELAMQYVVPKNLMAELLASNVRLEKILANPYAHILDQIEQQIKVLLDDPSLDIQSKNERYASLLRLQMQIKDELGRSMGWATGMVDTRQPSFQVPLGNVLLAADEGGIRTTEQRSPPQNLPQPQRNNPSTNTSSSSNTIAPQIPATRSSTTAGSGLSPNQRALILSVPSEQRQKAEELLTHLVSMPGRFDVNERGNVVLNGRPIIGSNYADIIATLFKLTPPTASKNPASYWNARLPLGTANFLSSFAQTALPSGLIRNPYLSGQVQEMRQGDGRSAQVVANAALAPSTSATAPSSDDFKSFADRYKALRARIYPPPARLPPSPPQPPSSSNGGALSIQSQNERKRLHR